MVVILWKAHWYSCSGIQSPRTGTSLHLHRTQHHTSYLICRCEESKRLQYPPQIDAAPLRMIVTINMRVTVAVRWAAGPSAPVSRILLLVFILCKYAICLVFTHWELTLWKLGTGSTLPCTLRVPQRGTHFRFDRAAFISQNHTPPYPHCLKTPFMAHTASESKQEGAYDAPQGPGVCCSQPIKTGQRGRETLAQTSCCSK